MIDFVAFNQILRGLLASIYDNLGKGAKHLLALDLLDIMVRLDVNMKE